MSQRHIPKESPLYDLIKQCCAAYCAANGLGSYAKHFAGVLQFDGPNAHIMASGILSAENFKPFRLDELMLVIRELGSYAKPILDYISTPLGFSTVPMQRGQALISSDNLTQDLPVSTLDLFGLVGKYADELRTSLADNSLSTLERKELARTVLDISQLCTSLLPALDPDLFKELCSNTTEVVLNDLQQSPVASATSEVTQ